MRKENRNGIEIDIYELTDGIEKGVITNWPNEPFVFYTDFGAKKISGGFVPRIIPSTIGRAFDREPGDIGIEQVVHPVVGMAAKFGEFGGFDAANYPKAVECMNFYLEQDGFEFRTNDNPEHIARAVNDGYLRAIPIDGTTVYFPTRDFVRAMCDTPFEKIDYMLALHTDVQFHTTANRRLPYWAGD